MFVILFTIYLIVTSVVAMRYGKASERLTAVTLLAAAGASPIVQVSGFSNIELGIFAIDLWVAVYLITLAIQSDRFWPLWASGFQIVGVSIHLLRILEPSLKPISYGTAEAIWAYPVLTSLLIGTLFEARRRPD